MEVDKSAFYRRPGFRRKEAYCKSCTPSLTAAKALQVPQPKQVKYKPETNNSRVSIAKHQAKKKENNNPGQRSKTISVSDNAALSSFSTHQQKGIIHVREKTTEATTNGVSSGSMINLSLSRDALKSTGSSGYQSSLQTEAPSVKHPRRSQGVVTPTTPLDNQRVGSGILMERPPAHRNLTPNAHRRSSTHDGTQGVRHAHQRGLFHKSNKVYPVPPPSEMLRLRTRAGSVSTCENGHDSSGTRLKRRNWVVTPPSPPQKESNGADSTIVALPNMTPAESIPTISVEALDNPVSNGHGDERGSSTSTSTEQIVASMDNLQVPTKSRRYHSGHRPTISAHNRYHRRSSHSVERPVSSKGFAATTLHERSHTSDNNLHLSGGNRNRGLYKGLVITKRDLEKHLPRRSFFDCHDVALKSAGFDLREFDKETILVRRRSEIKERKLKKEEAERQAKEQEDGEGEEEEADDPRPPRGRFFVVAGAVRKAHRSIKQQHMASLQDQIQINHSRFSQYLKLVKDNPEDFEGLQYLYKQQRVGYRPLAQTGMSGLAQIFMRAQSKGDGESAPQLNKSVVIKAAWDVQPRRLSKAQLAAKASQNTSGRPQSAKGASPSVLGEMTGAMEELDRTKVELEEWLGTLTTAQVNKAREKAIQEMGDGDSAIGSWWIANKFCRYLRNADDD